MAGGRHRSGVQPSVGTAPKGIFGIEDATKNPKGILTVQRAKPA